MEAKLQSHGDLGITSTGSRGIAHYTYIYGCNCREGAVAIREKNVPNLCALERPKSFLPMKRSVILIDSSPRTPSWIGMRLEFCGREPCQTIFMCGIVPESEYGG